MIIPTGTKVLSTRDPNAIWGCTEDKRFTWSRGVESTIALSKKLNPDHASGVISPAKSVAYADKGDEACFFVHCSLILPAEASTNAGNSCPRAFDSNFNSA